MYVEHAGRPDGPVLMLLHGGGVAGWMWRVQVRQFAAEFHVVVPDLPGHGKSAADEFTTIEAVSDELASVLAEARAEGVPITVAGFSLGGQIAVDLVARHPGLVDSAVVVSALALPLPSAALAARAATWLMPLARLRWFAKRQARALYIGADLFEEYFRTSRSVTAVTLQAVLAGNADFAPPEGWRRTGTRAVVVVGGKERGVMRRSARLLAGMHPAARLCIIESAGHGLPLQDPERFRTVLEGAAARPDDTGWHSP